MVRDRVLDEDDLVRPDYSQEWQTTDSVVGLFHMARRTPVPREVVPEPMSVIPHGDGLNVDGEGNEAIGQLYRMEDVTHGRKLTGGESDAVGVRGSATFGLMGGLADILAAAPDVDGIGEDANQSHSSAAFAGTPSGTSGSSSSQWDSIVQAAVDRVDSLTAGALAEKSRRGWLGRLMALHEFVGHSGTTRQLFRFVVAAVCCTGFGLWAVEYSKYEMSRFPTREVVEQNLRFFPLIGTCDVTDYWAILSLSVLLLGALAYWGAMEIEQRWLELD